MKNDELDMAIRYFETVPIEGPTDFWADHLLAAAKKYRAASPSEWQVPAGWKLVPIVPTKEMMWAMIKSFDELRLKEHSDDLDSDDLDKAKNGYAAMIAAAPPNNHNREGV